MAIHRLCIFSLVIILLLAGCTNSKLRTSIVPAYQLQDVHYFPTSSYITYIKKGNRGDKNEELSYQSEQLASAILKSNSVIYKLSNPVQFQFPEDSINAQNDIWALIEEIEFKNSLIGVELPPAVRLIMNENNTRFAMAVMVDGFVRRKGNYTGQVLLSIGIGVLTFGYYIPPMPLKSFSTLRVVILDAHRNEVAFYRRNMRENKSPLDPKTIDKQFNKLFKGYFY